jgi:hypothetical protein
MIIESDFHSFERLNKTPGMVKKWKNILLFPSAALSASGSQGMISA